MLNEKKSKRGTVIALLCALALLALVILLENTMKPTGMLFTVLKKGAQNRAHQRAGKIKSLLKT